MSLQPDPKQLTSADLGNSPAIQSAPAPEQQCGSQVIPASKAQCRQRSGRAGREAPGKCFRLFPESVFHKLSDAAVPEIQRSNLSSVVLQLKAVGVTDVLTFDFMDPPPRSALKTALSSLYALQAMVCYFYICMLRFCQARCGHGCYLSA